MVRTIKPGLHAQRPAIQPVKRPAHKPVSIAEAYAKGAQASRPPQSKAAQS